MVVCMVKDGWKNLYLKNQTFVINKHNLGNLNRIGKGNSKDQLIKNFLTYWELQKQFERLLGYSSS